MTGGRMRMAVEPDGIDPHRIQAYMLLADRPVADDVGARHYAGAG